jgi:hypothetical protein
VKRALIGDPPIGLPRGELVRFRLGSRDLTEYVDCRVLDTARHLRVVGGSALIITPHASNVVHIEVCGVKLAELIKGDQ